MRFGRGPSPDQLMVGSDGNHNEHALRRQPQPLVRPQGNQAGCAAAAKYDRRYTSHAREMLFHYLQGLLIV